MELLLNARDFRNAFLKARPFPHIVIDNLFPNNILEKVLENFPKPDGIDWKMMVNPREKKLATRDLSGLSADTRHFLYYLNSSPVINFLEELTGIEHLIPDPHFWGGGLHQIVRGGFLKIHADFNWHNRLALCRRLNLLIYLNKEWREEYGGHLELWPRNMAACEKKVLPVFNRTVVFSTTDFSYHGHPTPLECPDGISRKSIATYYYSNGRPKEEMADVHSTLFKRRGPVDWKESRGEKIVHTVKKLVPPVVFDAKRYLKTKFFPNFH